MAGFWNFMNEPVGGYSTVASEPIAEGMEFGQGGGFQTADSSLTWGQLIGAIAKMSQTQSGQAIGGAMQQQYGATGSGIPRVPGTTGIGEGGSAQSIATPGGVGGATPMPGPQMMQIGPTQSFYQPTDKPADSTGMILGLLGI